MDSYVLIGIAGTICSMIFGYIGYQRGLKTENMQQGSLLTDTQYIKRRIDDVLLEQKDTNKSINLLTERVAKVEESTKSAHRRLDSLEGKER